MSKVAFDTFALNDTRFQIQLENYLLGDEEDASDVPAVTESELLADRCWEKPPPEPHICTWDYMSEEEVTMLLEIPTTGQMRNMIERKLKTRPKGFPRIIIRELIYTVAKFCRTSHFSAIQAGAVLSQFYLTHLFFIKSLHIGAGKVYHYFKELQFCHSLPFPPGRIKLFNLHEIKSIMTYFCRLYLRNLPIIKLMSLPNFSLQTNYHAGSQTLLTKKKKGKKDKGKSKTKKKKKK